MRHVLLISSSVGLVAQVEEMLRAWGMHVEATATVAVARRRMAEGGRYDVVLVDADTLDCNPLEFARQTLLRSPDGAPPLAIVQPGRQRYAGSELLHAGYAAVLRSWNKEELFPVLRSPQPPAPLVGNAVPLRPSGPLRAPLTRRPILLAAALEMGRSLTAKILERAGYTVELVGDPEQTITALENRHYSALIVNAAFPNQGGIELVQLYRVLCGTGLEAIPVLMLTADTRVVHRQACIDAGADMCLTIPYDRRTLIAALHELTRVPVKAHQ